MRPVMTTDNEEMSLTSTLTATAPADAPGSENRVPPETSADDPIALRILEAQEQERARLAEELHDGPAQALANAIFRLEIVDRALRSQPAVAAKELRALRAVLEREMDRLRAFIHQLRPSLEEPDGLASAVGDAAERLVEETGIAVDVDLAAPEGMLDLPRRTAVLRIALEALRNIRKHSGAARVRVSTRLEAPAAGSDHPSWVLEVADDGRGFRIDEADARATRRHFGLRFMRERAQLVGAALEIKSDQAGGTTIRLSLDPLAEEYGR
jgi:two-component system sensor histidine kinase DegS